MVITASVKVIIFRVSSMDNWFAFEDACHDAPRSGWSRTPSQLGKGGRSSPDDSSTDPLTLGNYEFAECRLAQAHRLLEHCVEHRREITGRAVDDPQQLGSRRLLLQGVARLGDEPRVLDCDDRLFGEVLDQLDL